MYGGSDTWLCIANPSDRSRQAATCAASPSSSPPYMIWISESIQNHLNPSIYQEQVSSLFGRPCLIFIKAPMILSTLTGCFSEKLCPAQCPGIFYNCAQCVYLQEEDRFGIILCNFRIACRSLLSAAQRSCGRHQEAPTHSISMQLSVGNMSKGRPWY